MNDERKKIPIITHIAPLQKHLRVFTPKIANNDSYKESNQSTTQHKT